MVEHQRADVAKTHVRVAIIGAGFAGLGAALRLLDTGEQSFVVLEQADDVGGTWRNNVYPGVSCDIPSHLYSFSFAPKSNWRRHYAQGAEIQQYLRDCAATPGVAQRLRLSSTLHDARWNAAASRWELTTSRGRITASVLVLATGRFGAPQIPQIPGLASFTGPVCHSARWDDTIRPGMRVAVVGSGASAIQIVPALVAAGSEVVNIQRSAAWILPKGDFAYDAQTQQQFRQDDQARSDYRQAILQDFDAGFPARFLGSAAQDHVRHRALDHLNSQVNDEQLRMLLTPDYEIGCKRVLRSDDFYPAITSEHASLHRGTISEIYGQRLRLSNGTTHTVDALVFATGFEASQPPIATKVSGRNRLVLAEHWKHGMVSYASTVVAGFPNMFIVGGPNSALGHNSAIAMMETQIDQLLSTLEHLHQGWASFEVTAEAEQRYTAMLDKRAAKTVWLGDGCESWYRHNRTGRLTLLWPGTAAQYAAEYSRFHPEAFHLTDDDVIPQPVALDSTPAILP